MKKLLILICICLSIGAVANAADKTSTDVEITIEAENAVQAGTDIQTGDKTAWVKYVVALGVAVVAMVSVQKKKKGTLAVFALAFALLFSAQSVKASDMEENVSVTIPTTISITFDQSGENQISMFEVNNQSLVPITIHNIQVTEYNQWKLVGKGSEIPADTKELVFQIEDTCLRAGANSVSISVPEQTQKTLGISVERGAWSKANQTQKALGLELEYTLGKKEFELKFDTAGSGENIATKRVCNGETIELPSAKREGYQLAGWEDEKGNLYTEMFVMPIGDTTLKARWKEEIAYAIYSASDTSLRFVRSADEIRAGDTYNGRSVTAVFTGFEENTYASFGKVPWYDGNKYNTRVITKVVFEDVIRPKSTANWFHYMGKCSNLDVSKLDMSQVTDMSYMFAHTGDDSSVKTITITGISEWNVSKVSNMEGAFTGMGFNAATVRMDLSRWNVSNVTNMYDMFFTTAYFATSFSLGDLSKWNVSNVTDMGGMFQQTAGSATWSLNLSNWNVKKVTYYKCFCLFVESKITQPKWVN